MESKVCLVVGAGEGAGSGIARTFAKAGFEVCLTRRPRNIGRLQEQVDAIRTTGGKAHAFPCDAREEDDVVELFRRIEAEVGPIEVMVFNIGANVRFSAVEATARVFRKVWEMACFSGFLAGREAAKVMIPRGRGTIIFTGATASVRGSPMRMAFSSAKPGLRAISRSLARELGPQGIHVAHVIIDGAIEGQFASQNRPDYAERLARDAVLRTDDIGKFYLDLHNQPRSTWVYEADLRPWEEKWEWS
jgi:NAD(P)-dependent dehydrogenase (short-subunit alcohol dehydrogenase family)